MNKPKHKSAITLPSGLRAKCISSTTPVSSDGFEAHSDDYYIFGYIESGESHVRVDFEDKKLTTQTALIIIPGQMHSFVTTSDDTTGYVMLIDSVFVSELQQTLLFGGRSVPISVSKSIAVVLSDLFSLLTAVEPYDVGLSESFFRHIALAIIDAMCMAVSEKCSHEGFLKRYLSIANSFFCLLKDHLTVSRKPSYYASLMNISQVYLNEAIKGVTGRSVSRNIVSEIIIRAKRCLAYSNDDVKEIALKLGFTDYSYFTRLFTREVGVSPTTFRKNLE